MHAVLITPTFQRQAKEALLSADAIDEICDYLAHNPRAGVVIRGAGGARKTRFAGRGRGKSGGYRIVHFYAADDVPVFLLGLIDKGRRADISASERNQLAKVLPALADAYREGVRSKVKQLKR